MTSFKIINDDVGVRGLKEKNKTPVISGPVMPVKASKPVQKSPENLSLNRNKTNHRGHQSQHLQRRQADRRKTDSPVLLDTRSQHDRRTKREKTDDDENNEVKPLHGIDEMI